MLRIQHQVSLAETRPVSFSAKPLANGAPSPRPPATFEGEGYTCRYANSEQNGRVAAPAPASAWRVRWIAPTASPPTLILRTADRILVQGGGWQLLTPDGKAVGEGPGGPGSAVADGRAGLFYQINRTNYMEARFLKDGELAFQSPLLTNERWVWPLIARLGPRLLMMGFERALAAHPPRPGTRSEIDMMEFEPQLRVDAYKQILSLSRSEILHFNQSPMVFAAGKGSVYAAGAGYIVAADTGFNVKAVYEADFKPVALSADESGYLYLIVETQGRRAFWVVTPEGRRPVARTLEPEHQSASFPPVVSANHQAYVLTQSAVLAFDPAGKLVWQRQVTGEIAGATVSQDEKLLVAAGSDLTIFDAQGHDAGHHHFEGERLTTAPVLTRRGGAVELLVGAEKGVHSLTPQ